MRSKSTRRRLVWAAVAAPAAVGVAALALALNGCGALTTPADVPAGVPFPARTDRLVLSTPDRDAPGPGETGKLEDEIAALDGLGGKTLDPAALSEPQRAALAAALADLFGTPAAPKVPDAPWRPGLSADRLAEGGKLFRRHCIQCHGLAGDGRGPTGPWVVPHPRDFRRGAFKFTSTGAAKPRRADLLRTLREGLKTTAMPSFAALPDDQRELLAAYVTYLSVRGQTEFDTIRAVLADADGAADDLPGYARDRAARVFSEWERAEDTPAPPAAPPAVADDDRRSPGYLDAVRRGYQTFTAATPGAAGCVSCHKNFGRDDVYKYDVWGTVVRPANLTLTAKKGGGDPAELFQRVRHGIAPSGMPAHPHLTDAQVWDVVRFLRALPYPADLPYDVRPQVYPAP